MDRAEAERLVDVAWERAEKRRNHRGQFRVPARVPTKVEREEIATTILAAVAAERERCRIIVARHPDEAHPASIDPELIRGCCEVMEGRIMSGEPEDRTDG
jgi:hypothetical protein